MADFSWVLTKTRWLKRNCLANERAARLYLNTTFNMDTKQNINIILGSNSKIMSIQIKISTNDWATKSYIPKDAIRAIGIAQESETIRMTRRRFINVKYCKGFMTAT